MHDQIVLCLNIAMLVAASGKLILMVPSFGPAFGEPKSATLVAKRPQDVSSLVSVVSPGFEHPPGVLAWVPTNRSSVVCAWVLVCVERFWSIGLVQLFRFLVPAIPSHTYLWLVLVTSVSHTASGFVSGFRLSVVRFGEALVGVCAVVSVTCFVARFISCLCGPFGCVPDLVPVLF